MNNKKLFLILILVTIFFFSCSKEKKLKWKYSLGETLKVQTDPLYIQNKDIIVTWRVDIKKLNRKKKEGDYVVPKVNTLGSDIEMELQNKRFYANLVALDIKTGKEVWKTVTLGASDQNLSSPSYSNGKIYVGSDYGYVYEINPENGKISWQYDTGSWVYSEIFVNKEYILTGNENGYLFLWNRQNKDLIFKKEIDYIEKKWFIKDNFIYGSSQNAIYKLNLDGEILKKYRVDDKYKNFSNETVKHPPIKSKLLLTKEYCYFTAESNYLYKLNINNWKIEWKTKLNTSFSSPVLYKGNIFIGTDKNLVAINSKNGKIIHKYKTNNRWIDFDINFRKGGPVNGDASVHNGNVYFGSYDYSLYAYDIDTEKLLWKYKIKHHIDRTKPIVTDRFVSFGADSHHLYLIGN